MIEWLCRVAFNGARRYYRCYTYAKHQALKVRAMREAAKAYETSTRGAQVRGVRRASRQEDEAFAHTRITQEASREG